MTEMRSVASMFPPERTIPTGPSPGTFPARSAATPTAPAPSTTSFARSSRRTIAVEISSSDTDTSPLSSPSRIDIVNSPGALTAIPSAIVKPLPPGRQLAAGAVAPRRLDLGHRRVLRYEDRRRDADLAGGPRHRLSVVARARRHDA